MRRHTRYDALPGPERRGLSRAEAAAYVGVSPSLFDQMVADGRMPKPKGGTNSRRIWDRRRLDAAFDALPDHYDADADDVWSNVAT